MTAGLTEKVSLKTVIPGLDRGIQSVFNINKRHKILLSL